MAYSASSIPRPKDWQDFERKARVLFAQILNDPLAQTNGRPGQRQNGVDIFGRRDGSGALVGIQCKGKDAAFGNAVSKKELRREVAAARTFKQPLDEFILITTAPDDTKIQQEALVITNELAGAKPPLRVAVWGWNTLEQHISEYRAAYKAFLPDATPYSDELISLIKNTRSDTSAIKNAITDFDARLPSGLSFLNGITLNTFLLTVFGVLGWAVTDSGPAAAGTALIGLLLGLVYQYYLEVLRSSSEPIGSAKREPYVRFRASMEKGGLAKEFYILGTSAFLRAVARFFGDANATTGPFYQHLFRLKHAVPLWTAPAFDRCLLIAGIYPLTSIIVFWSVSGKVSQAQELIKLPPNLSAWQLALEGAALVFEIIAIKGLIQAKSWTSVAWSVAGGAFSIALAVAAAGIWGVAAAFALGATTALIIAAFLSAVHLPLFFAFSSSRSRNPRPRHRASATICVRSDHAGTGPRRSILDRS